MRSNSPPAGQLRSREVDSDLISCWISLCARGCGVLPTFWSQLSINTQLVSSSG